MTFALVLVVSLLSGLGQVAQKVAVERWRGRSVSLWRKLTSPWMMFGLASLGTGLLLWLLVLQQLEVGMAYPMLSLNFVWITLAAHRLFHEHIDGRHWLGIVLIMVGIVLLSTQR
ncbi:MULTISPECIES: 4-amino-4-deoxy-L-arabinose-phosphoundecaprenol flippase subunit ArnE [Pseudomonas]|uniref:4-amino-4-deoxy-L-arabinose-phosphoundecaprenol flippase subunit ArnE n=1 Tax=Pseudomonas sp. MAG002Y TaxID=2678690 RepID=UPI001C6099C7|nr:MULTISPECIES: 4-amino-4-deoxy-L-arabinose-phosphoundecaprenol flippase subunit ArnE [Pseudomonas]MBW5411671.1 EamA family transporter [Pseudomonas sp. MAG002Y]